MTPRPTLLIGSDGYFEQFDFDKAYGDKATSSVMVSGLVRTPLSRMGGVGEVLEKSDWSKEIVSAIEWTSRSVGARLGMEVHEFFPSDGTSMVGEQRHGEQWLVPVTVAFRPWEDREGRPVENPLVEYLRTSTREMLLEAGRPFLIMPGASPISGDDLLRAVTDEKTIRINKDAQVVQDGLHLFPHDTHFRLRADLVDLSHLDRVLRGSGRGAIEAMQPPIKNWQREIQPHSYAITATRFSLLPGYAAVIDPQMVLRDGTPSEMKHGKSTLWDGGKTTGFSDAHERHLEEINGTGKRMHVHDHGVKIRVYNTANGNGNGAENSLERVFRAYPDRVHDEGLNLDHPLTLPEHTTVVRRVLDYLDESEETAAVLLSPRGATNIRAEVFDAEQSMAFRQMAQKYAQHSPGFQDWPELAELGGILSQMGDPRQRAVLFAKEAPSHDAIAYMMQHGIRGIFTRNISRSQFPSQQVYVTPADLQQYKNATRHGLALYLVTAEKIRRQWNEFFVDVNALERVKNADFRVGGYAASAPPAAKIMALGDVPGFFELVKRDYPNMALVTGAGRTGGMQYLQETAREMGITTIGIANYIRGQEEAGDELDAVTYFDANGFIERQALMAKTVSYPVISIGAEGTNFEEALERVRRKIGVGPLSMISYVDPVNIDRGKHNMWSPVKGLERIFGTPIYPPNSPGFQLSRSPFVKSLMLFSSSYKTAYQASRPFFENPLEYLRGIGVPNNVIQNAVGSMLSDCQLTGLPMHAFWQPILEDPKNRELLPKKGKKV